MKFKYILIGIVSFSFFLRLGFFLKNPNFNYTNFKGESLPSETSYFKKAMSYDSQEYKTLALNIIKHRKFSWDSEPTTFRTPGYPLFISCIYFLFGIKDWVVMLFQVFLSTASVYLIYLIGRGVKFNAPACEVAGIISASLFTIDFTSILFSSLFMGETLFVFSLLLGTWLFLKRNSFSGLVFGFAALIRPIGIYIFLPLVFMWVIGLAPLEKKCLTGLASTLRRRLSRGFIFLVLFFLPIAPWVCRNYKIYHFPMLSSLGGFNLLFSHAALLESEETGVSIDEAQSEFSKRLPDSNNPLELASLAQKIGLARIMSSPLRYALIHFKGALRMLFSTKSDDILLRICGADIVQSRLSSALREQPVSFKIIVLLFAVLEITIVAGSIIFAFTNFIRFPHFPKLFFFVLGCYFLLFSGGPFGESRYRLPLIPYMYLLASCVKRR